MIEHDCVPQISECKGKRLQPDCPGKDEYCDPINAVQKRFQATRRYMIAPRCIASLFTPIFTLPRLGDR